MKLKGIQEPISYKSSKPFQWCLMAKNPYLFPFWALIPFCCTLKYFLIMGFTVKPI